MSTGFYFRGYDSETWWQNNSALQDFSWVFQGKNEPNKRGCCLTFTYLSR